MTWLQAGTDTGIHITISAAVVGLVGHAIYEKWRAARNGEKNGECRYDDQVLKDIRDGIRDLVLIARMKGGNPF